MRLPLCFIIIIAVFLFSCTREKLHHNESDLPGKWQLSAYYLSPGDNHVEWTAANPDQLSFVEFTSAGKMIFSGYGGERTYSYTVNENQIHASNDSITVQYSFSVKGNELTLNGGGCIEACASKYRRMVMPL